MRILAPTTNLVPKFGRSGTWEADIRTLPRRRRGLNYSRMTFKYTKREGGFKKRPFLRFFRILQPHAQRRRYNPNN
jgi:hypothetical protein